MALPRPVRLTNGQVALRPPEVRDILAITEACQDPEIDRWTRVPSPYRKEHARAWVEAQPEEAAVSLLAVGADSDELLGSVGLTEVDLGRRRGEIGFWTAPWARHRGVASGALRLLARWSFDALDVARVQALAHRANEASQRTLERAGFVREGLLRSYEEIKGERWDVAVFSLLAEELESELVSRR